MGARRDGRRHEWPDSGACYLGSPGAGAYEDGSAAEIPAIFRDPQRCGVRDYPENTQVDCLISMDGGIKISWMLGLGQQIRRCAEPVGSIESLRNHLCLFGFTSHTLAVCVGGAS